MDGSSSIHPLPRSPLLREIPFRLPVDFNRVSGLSLPLKFLVLTTDGFQFKNDGEKIEEARDECFVRSATIAS